MQTAKRRVRTASAVEVVVAKERRRRRSTKKAGTIETETT